MNRPVLSSSKQHLRRVRRRGRLPNWTKEYIRVRIERRIALQVETIKYETERKMWEQIFK